MFFSRRAGHKYVDRGDIETVDYLITDFTKDGAWHDLDLSSKIPVNAVMVYMLVAIKSNTVNHFVKFRTNGFVNAFNLVSFYTQVIDVYNYINVFIKPDVNGIIEYKSTIDETGELAVTILGWLI